MQWWEWWWGEGGAGVAGPLSWCCDVCHETMMLKEMDGQRRVWLKQSEFGVSSDQCWWGHVYEQESGVMGMGWWWVRQQWASGMSHQCMETLCQCAIIFIIVIIISSIITRCTEVDHIIHMNFIVVILFVVMNEMTWVLGLCFICVFLRVFCEWMAVSRLLLQNDACFDRSSHCYYSELQFISSRCKVVLTLSNS